MKVSVKQVTLTWTEAAIKALRNLGGKGSEDEILEIIESRRYRSFERSKTPKRSLNRTLNEHLDGQVKRIDGKWVLSNLEADEIVIDDDQGLQLGPMENPDSLDGITALENKMRNLTPSARYHLSKRIERGAIANKVKKLLGYKCQLCEAKGDNPFGFLNRSGVYYIETHHVEQVSLLKKGTLSLLNMITVCPNHHRHLHFGNVVVVDLGDAFSFKIGEMTLRIEKTKIK